MNKKVLLNFIGCCISLAFILNINTKTALSLELKSVTDSTSNIEHIEKPKMNVITKLLTSSNYETRTEDITHIVLHFISNVANNPSNPYNIDEVYSILDIYGLSVHYVIDRDGTIYLMTPEEMVAYHAGKGSLKNLPEYENRLNHYSIGIELMSIGTKDEMSSILSSSQYDSLNSDFIGFTEAQYNSLNMLLDDISSRYPNIVRDRQHIIGHSEYTSRKTDPGSLFNWGNVGL